MLPAACCGLDVSIPQVTPGVYSLFVQGSNSVQSNVVTLQIAP